MEYVSHRKYLIQISSWNALSNVTRDLTIINYTKHVLKQMLQYYG